MEILKICGTVLFGLASGGVIATAVVAFVTAIGVVPRLAQKTRTESHIRLFEEAILFGGVLGSVLSLNSFSVNAPLVLGNLALVAWGLAAGIFYGSLAMSLTEVLDVIPIMTRRVRLKYGLRAIVIAIAGGKMAGSFIYFLAMNMS